jgi:hypothetical protein
MCGVSGDHTPDVSGDHTPDVSDDHTPDDPAIETCIDIRGEAADSAAVAIASRWAMRCRTLIVDALHEAEDSNASVSYEDYRARRFRREPHRLWCVRA